MNAVRLGLLTAVFALAPGGAALAADRPPNIVIIFTDDQGYGDVGCFGAKGFETPNLDRLAREGRRFTNFHVAQPVCSASRTALLTGCYPNRLGIHGALGPKAKHGIADGETTLAQLLKQRGYATGMAGKWHLGHHPRFLPVHHGFDEYLGLPYSNDMWPIHPGGEARHLSAPPLDRGRPDRRFRRHGRRPVPADRPLHRACRLVHQAPQGSALLLLPRALDAARAAARRATDTAASRSRGSMAT